MRQTEDERLDALLAAVRADAEPGVWARARARLEAGREEPRWVAWLGRPAALAAAAAVLIVALGGSVVLLRDSAAQQGSTSMTDALLAERGVLTSAELGETAVAGASAAASDSGSLQ